MNPLKNGTVTTRVTYNDHSASVFKSFKDTGLADIVIERHAQLFEHNRTTESDVINNGDEQLTSAALRLILNHALAPEGWSQEVWDNMINKPYRQRLVMAAALLAAEIDRLDYVNKTESNDTDN